MRNGNRNLIIKYVWAMSAFCLFVMFVVTTINITSCDDETNDTIIECHTGDTPDGTPQPLIECHTYGTYEADSICKERAKEFREKYNY